MRGRRIWFPWLQDKDRQKCEGILMNNDIAFLWFLRHFVCCRVKMYSPNQGWQNVWHQGAKESESQSLGCRNEVCWVTPRGWFLSSCFTDLVSTSVRWELSRYSWKSLYSCPHHYNNMNTFGKGLWSNKLQWRGEFDLLQNAGDFFATRFAYTSSQRPFPLWNRGKMFFPAWHYVACKVTFHWHNTEGQGAAHFSLTVNLI